MDNKCHIILNASFSNKIRSVIKKNISDAVDENGNPLSIKDTEFGIIVRSNGIIELDIDTNKQSGDIVLRSLANLLQTRQRDLFITEEKGKVLTTTFNKELFKKGSEQIYQYMLEEIRNGNLQYASFIGEFRYSTDYLLNQIESIKNDNTLSKEEKDIRIKTKIRLLNYTKTQHENQIPVGAKAVARYQKFQNKLRLELEKLTNEYIVDTTFTPENYKIPATVQIHYDTYLSKEDNSFFLEDDVELSEELQELNNNIISVLINEGYPVRKATRKKEPNGYSFMFWQYNREESNRLGKDIWDRLEFPKQKGQGTVDVLFNNDTQYQVYVQDGTRINAGESSAQTAEKQFFTSRELEEDIKKRQGDTSGLINSFDAESLNIRINKNVSVLANERLAKEIQIYNSKVNKEDQVNPDFIFGAGRIPLLGTKVKVIRKTENGWEITEEPYNQFVTKGFNKNVDFVIFSNKKVMTPDGVETIEEIGAEGDSWSYNIVTYTEGEEVKTDFVNIDKFFDSGKFQSELFEKFITDHFSMAYDMNSNELKEVHDLLYKEDVGNSLLSALLSNRDNVIKDKNGRDVPRFIPYRILKEFLVEKDYYKDDQKHKRASLYYSLLNPIAYSLLEAKVAKDSIAANVDVQMTVKEFGQKVTEYGASVGFEINKTAETRRLPLVKLDTGNYQELDSTDTGLVKFKAYRKNGKFIKLVNSYEVPEDAEEVELTTSFYYYTNKETNDAQLTIGEVLEGNKKLSNKDIVLVEPFALKGLQETLNLDVPDDILTKSDLEAHIVPNTMLNYGWNTSGNVLLVPYGNKLVPSKVKAKVIDGDANIANRLKKEVTQDMIDDFKRKQAHFKRLVPFMFIFHQYREFYSVMTRATSMSHNDKILNEFSGNYTIEINGKRVPVWKYLGEILSPLRKEIVAGRPNSEEILQQVYDPNSAETIDEFREILFNNLGIMNPNIDQTGLGKLYEETENLLGITKQKEALKRGEKVKPIDDVEIVKVFTEKVLNSIDISKIEVGRIFKGDVEITEDKDFVNGFMQSYVDNVLNKSIATSLPSIMPIQAEGYSESRKSFLYASSLTLVLVRKALRRSDKNNPLIDEITEYLQLDIKDKVDKLDEINQMLLSTIGDKTILQFTNDEISKLSKDKLNVLFRKSTLNDLWSYDEKIMVLNVKGESLDDGGSPIKTSLSIPLRLEFKGKEVHITGNFRFLDYVDGNIVYNPSRGHSYLASFSLPISYFNPSTFKLSEFKKRIVEQLIENKKTDYNKRKEDKKEIDEFGQAVLDGKFDKFITDLVKDVNVFEHIPAPWEESTRGLSANRISRSKLLTNLKSKDPFYTVLRKPSKRLEIFKPITKDSTEADAQAADKLKIAKENLTQNLDETEIPFYYLQESNDQFKNDYDISNEEIDNYLSLVTGKQVTLESWQSDAIKDLIKRSRIQGTPVGVSFRNLISLNTESAGVFYHEVFHQVFNGLLYPSERTELLNTLGQRVFVSEEMLEEFKQERGLQGRSESFIKSKYLEEKLADMFGQYKLDQKKNKDSFWRRMLGNKIVDFFESILTYFKLIKNDKITQFFDKMDSGYYAERTHLSFERPDFSIIYFTDGGVQRTILQNKFMLKNKLVDFLSDPANRSKTEQQKLDEFSNKLLKETIVYIKGLSKIEHFKNLSTSELRSLQDKILLPVYAGITSSEYRDAIKSLLFVDFKAINESNDSYVNPNKTNYTTAYFKNLIVYFQESGKPNFENTSKENLNILYKEIQKQGLPEWNASEAADGSIGEDGTEIDPEKSNAHENFEGSNLNIDPSATLSKYIKTLVGGYVLEREIVVNVKGDTIKLPIELDSLTVYNSLIKLFAGKDINTKDFEKDKNLFLDTLDFYAEMHYRSSPKYEYTGVQEFRDFIYRYFEIDKVKSVLPVVDEKEFVIYDRTIPIPSSKHGDMIRFLFAFSNNISEFNLLNITEKNDYFFTPTQRHSIVKDVLEGVGARRKGIKLKNKETEDSTAKAIGDIISQAQSNNDIYERTKTIKELLQSIGIKFSTEYILFSLASRTKREDILKHFNKKFKPISFEQSYFDSIFKLSNEDTKIEDIENAENDDTGKTKNTVSVKDVYWSIYASVFFNAQMSTLTIKDSNGKDRYVITKDSHIGNTFKDRYWVRADGLVTGKRGQRKKSVTDLTNPTEAKQFAIGALFGSHGLGDNIGFYPIGQMETTKDKFFVSGKKENLVHITDQGVISISDGAVRKLLSIVNEELSIIDRFLTHIKTNHNFKGIDKYMQPVYKYVEVDGKKVLDEKATIEATIKANKLTKLFEIETLLNKKDFVEFRDLVWDAIRNGSPLNAETIDSSIKEKLINKVKFEVEREHKSFTKIPVPNNYSYAGDVTQDKKLEHMAWNAVLNMMINGREVLHEVYGEFGATFKDMQADRLKRAKSLAALGASFSSYRSKEIEDVISHMVIYDGRKTLSDGTTKGKFRIEVDSFETLLTRTREELTNREFLTAENIEVFNNLKSDRELEMFLDNLDPDNFKVRNPESTDGDSIVSPLHRIQQFHDLARTDTKNNKMSMYVISEGFMWLDDNNRPVRFDRARHQKEYEKCVEHSIKTNANFGKYKTVAVYKEEVLGVEALKYIKQSEFVLTGELVRTLRKDLTNDEKATIERIYTEMFTNAHNANLSIEERFMGSGAQYTELEKFYKVKPGAAKMYDWFKDITRNDIGHLVFLSASKTAKRVNQITTVPFGAKMLQQEVPNWKEEALSGTQMMEHILSDQDSDLEVFVEGKLQKMSDIKQQFRQNLVDMFNVDKNLVLESLKLYSTGKGYEGDVNYEALYEIIRKSMIASGRTDYDIQEFTTDESGNPNYNIVPARFHNYMNMVSSILNKAYKLKRNAESYAIASSRFHQVAISKRTGKIVSHLHRNESEEDYTYRQLEVTDQIRYYNGKAYEVEVHECVVSSSREYEHLLLNQELTEEQMLAILPMDSPLREMLGYRIPTEGKRSMKIFKIVDFLPPYYGSTIITTTQSMLEDGHDFDIDKQYTEKPYEVETPNRIFTTIDGLSFSFKTFGKYYQAGYIYSQKQIENTTGILLSEEYVDLFNEELSQNTIEHFLRIEVGKRKDPEQILELRMLKEKVEDRKDISEVLREQIKSNIRFEIEEYQRSEENTFETLLNEMSPLFREGISLKNLINKIGQESYDKMEEELKPYIVRRRGFDFLVTKPYSEGEDVVQNKIFAKLVGLMFRNIENQMVNEIIESFEGDKQMIRDEFYKTVEELKIKRKEIEEPIKEHVIRYSFHMFPIYANKQLELGKVLLSNDHTRFVNKKQTEETDKTYFDAETEMQLKINIADEVRYFNTISQQVTDSISTIRGAKNIGITASAGKQGVSYAENGLQLRSKMELKYKDEKGKQQTHIFGDFQDIGTELYNKLEGISIDEKVKWLLSLEKDGVKLLDEKEVREYERIMRKHLMTSYFTSTTFLGKNITLTTDSVKDNRQIPLNLIEDVIAIDSLLIQLNMPYQLRVGIFTHRSIREISKLQEEGLTKDEIISAIESKFGTSDKEKPKEEKKTDEEVTEEEIDDYIEVPSLEDIYTEENGEHVMNIVNFYYSALAISKAMIPLNKLTGMTKGISNDLNDYPDYIALAQWIGLKPEDVLIDAVNDKSYVRFVENLFEGVSKRKPPVLGLENYINNVVIKNQLINFFDYYLYIMYQVTPIKNRMVQEGMLTFLNTGLDWSTDVMIPLLGQDYAIREQATIENETISLKSVNTGTVSDFKVMDLFKSLDSLIKSYSLEKSLFAGLVKTGRSSLLKYVPTMNGFTPMNPESIRYMKSELSNEALDPIARVNFKHEGLEYSIALRDVIKLFHWANLLETGMVKTSTSISDLIPLNHRLFKESDKNFYLPATFKNMISSLFNELDEFTKSKIKPLATPSNRVNWVGGFAVVLKDGRSMRRTQHEFGTLTYRNDKGKKETGIFETVYSFDVEEVFTDEKGKEKKVKNRLVVYKPVNKSSKLSYMTPYTLSLLGNKKIELLESEPKTKTENDYVLTEGEFIANTKISFTTKNGNLSIGDVIEKDKEIFIIKTGAITKSEGLYIYGLIPFGADRELQKDDIERIKALKNKLELEIYNIFVPTMKSSYVKISKDEAMRKKEAKLKTLKKEGKLPANKKRSLTSLSKYLRNRTEEQKLADQKQMEWEAINEDTDGIMMTQEDKAQSYSNLKNIDIQALTDYITIADLIETYDELNREDITELDKERIRKESGLSCKI